MAASLSRHQSSSSVNAYSLKIGGSVVLKSMFDLIKIVAKGILQNTDSTTSIRGQQLGANWYEVHVFVLMDWDEELIRPYSRLKTIGDALGTSIAWPRNMCRKSTSLIS
ncbi:hypothetical protein ACH5RR_033677 [Cinchona calisaya]|uniref:Transposase Tnp1/En/Spm-like domain-containing protein n=1 Tax=Cinchona calisaya TaxID=153742 RepID=A0ABD2Y9Y0_9GENT